MGRIIKNYKQLEKTKIRKDVLDIITEGLITSSPSYIFEKEIKLEGNKLKIRDKIFDLSKFQNIYVIGAGKVSGEMAYQLEKILGDRITAGIVICNKAKKTKTIKVKCGTHPIVSLKNVKITKKILQMAENAQKNDLVICLISGGGSALLENPNISLGGLIEINKKLLLSGASIDEINIIRKHLSKTKGGKLTQKICPATQITLIFSDVPGNDLGVIASGPTVLDKSTKYQAKKIAKKYNLLKVKFTETPKEGGIFKKTDNILLLTNKTFLRASEEVAKKLGYKTKIYSDSLTCEAKKAGKKLAELSKKQEKNSIILAGGETPVIVRGKGRGGRCTELALAALKYLTENVTLCAFASDGQDNTDAAGAIVDENTIKRAKQLKLDINKYLKNNDSYTFFQKTEGLIFTGPTGTNVSDLFLMIKK